MDTHKMRQANESVDAARVASTRQQQVITGSTVRPERQKPLGEGLARRYRWEPPRQWSPGRAQPTSPERYLARAGTWQRVCGCRPSTIASKILRKTGRYEN